LHAVQCDVLSYTSAISACEKCSEWQRALSLLQDLHLRSLSPNRITYIAVAAACDKASAWQPALTLLADMTQHGLAPGADMYFVVLLALVGCNRLSQALLLYREAVERGAVRPQHRTEPGVLDLHTMPTEVAKLAVRAAVLDALRGKSSPCVGESQDFPVGEITAPRLVFVTGRGKHSDDGEALLRPAVLRVLREEFGLEGYVDVSNAGQGVRTGTGVWFTIGFRFFCYASGPIYSIPGRD
jgi:pentatricopeptide repeat protein